MLPLQASYDVATESCLFQTTHNVNVKSTKDFQVYMSFYKYWSEYEYK